MGVMSVKDREAAIEALREVNGVVDRAREVLEADAAISALTRRGAVDMEALAAFAEAAAEVLGDEPLSVPAARRAGLLAAAGHAWENELGPLFTSAQVRELLGGVSRQRVDELLRKRRLIGLLDRDGRRRFPTFQFLDGRPQESLIDAFWIVADAAVTPWTAASWCVSADDALDGLSPAGWARDRRDAGRLLTVARRDAARLAQ